MRKLLSAVLALLIVVSMMGTAVFAAEGESNAAGYAGIYEGTCTYQPNGMPMAIEYSFTMTLKADGTYTFVSTYAVSGNTYDGLNENGTYTIDGTALTVTAADGSVWSGTISDGVINMNRPVSTAMSGSGYGSSFDVTMTLGGTTGEEPADPTEPSEPADSVELTSGCYAVDISWSPMAAMFAPILEVDADAMAFDLYNETAPETSKGSGTISYDDGVYTLIFDNGNTTTFTYENGVITFTTRLWYGSASFNQTDDNGNFIPYIATLIDQEDAGSIDVSGSYEGTHAYQPTGMPMKLMYHFTMTLNDDGIYSFECHYGTDETYCNREQRIV